MIPWQARAWASFGLTVAGQVAGVALRRPGASVLPLLRRREPAPDPPPALLGSRGAGGARIVAVLHCHFVDVLPDLLQALETIPEPFDLLITTTSDLALPAVLPDRVTSVRILRVDNRGRDILPLLRLVNAGMLDDYEVVCKVHTKKSTWRRGGARFDGGGAQWRDELVRGILGSPELVVAVLRAFERDPGLAMVTAPGQVLGPPYWGANIPLVLALGRRGRIAVDPGRLRFAAGSMYWARSDVLRRLGDLRLRAAHFDSERGQDDGTTAHAVERYLGYLATSVGTIVTTDELVGRG